MTYTTKIAYVLDVDDFMQTSRQVAKNLQRCKDMKGRDLNGKDIWRVVNNQIRRKVTNSQSVRGVCSCDSNMLCEHRKKYLKVILDGKKKY